MGDEMSGRTVEELVAHAASVRALAAHLLGDAHLGEDVAQDAALVALTKPPAGDAPLGPWLRGVARHLAFRRIRADARRRRREASAARPESGREDDVVERAELRQVVVAELLAMDDPYRRALLLRWFEDLAPAEIARREGVPAGTVRSWLSRGAEMLRARLDARHAGGRRTWAVPLAALLDAPAAPSAPNPPSSAAPVAAGVVAMAAKWVVAVVLVAAAGVAWWAVRGDAADVAQSPEAPAGATHAADTALAPRVRAPPAEVAAPAPSPPAVGSAPATLADVWVAGRVVGDERHPAADVDVALVVRDGATVRVRTDAEGRFRLPAKLAASDGDTTSAVVHARASDGRAAIATLALAAGATDADAGTLVLGPADAIDVDVRAGETPVADVQVTVIRGVIVASARTNASGRARLEGLPHDNYLFVAGDAERGHAAHSASIPAADGRVALVLTRRDVTVTVVRKGSGTPVPGARIVAWFSYTDPRLGNSVQLYDPPLATEPTAADGTVLLRGAGAQETVYVAIAPPSGRSPGLGAFRGEWRAKPGVSAVRIEVPDVRSFRFRITDGEVAPPPEGTVLRLVPWTNSGTPVPADTAVVRDGAVVVENVGASNVNCFALAPDGAIAKLVARAESGDGSGTSFRRERTIEVLVRDADGKPVAGRYVVARDQGNNAIQPPAPTGDDGRVVFRGLWGYLADVYVLADVRPPAAWGGARVGSVDLDQGSARLEYTVPREIRVRLLVRIGDRAALPTRYTFQGARVLGEDAAAGTIDVGVTPARPGAPARLSLAATGFQTERIDVPAGAAGAVEIPVRLRRAGALACRLLLPSDGRARVMLQTWDATANAWTPWTPGGGISPDGVLRPDESGAVRLDSVPPGRYRLADAATRLTGPPVDVPEGGSIDAGTFDVTKSGWVRGRVVVPEGAPVAGAQIVVAGEGLSATAVGWDSPGNGVSRDGTFAVRVPGDRTVALRVVHPTLRAAAGREVVEVSEPRDGVELALERGPVVTLRAPSSLRSGEFGAQPRILVYSGEPAGTPLSELSPEVVGDTMRLGAPRPGRYTLWIDAVPRAPLVLRDVTIGDADLDLGKPGFPAGSSVRIRLLVKDGQSAPRIGAFATREDAPAYTRSVNSNGESEVVLAGLGPGKFRLTMAVMHSDPGAGMQPPRTIEVDGAEGTVVTIELDLR